MNICIVDDINKNKNNLEYVFEYVLYIVFATVFDYKKVLEYFHLNKVNSKTKMQRVCEK